MGCNQRFYFSYCYILTPEVDPPPDTPEFPWELVGQDRRLSSDGASLTSLRSRLLIDRYMHYIIAHFRLKIFSLTGKNVFLHVNNRQVRLILFLDIV